VSEARPIDFWFDFISPYGYFASLRIEELAAQHGRGVRWRPMLLGVTVLKVMGLKPLMDTPLKGDYVERDLRRTARRESIPLGRDLRSPPMNPVPAARVMAWLGAHDQTLAGRFADCVFRRYWAAGEEMDNAVHLEQALVEAGASSVQAARALQRSPAAELLQAGVQAAVEAGVFGSPFVVIDGEPFWGYDALPAARHWLAHGF
jgi:2-hydroxychromene-2-carboxylate isomerase